MKHALNASTASVRASPVLSPHITLPLTALQYCRLIPCKSLAQLMLIRTFSMGLCRNNSNFQSWWGMV